MMLVPFLIMLREGVAATLLRRGSSWALIFMAFLAVAREGLESIFFLLAVLHQSRSYEGPLGATLGLLVAVMVGWVIYQGGIRINLAKFFRWTGVFLIFVAAGLVSGTFRSLHEAGALNFHEQFYDWSSFLSEDSTLGPC